MARAHATPPPIPVPDAGQTLPAESSPQTHASGWKHIALGASLSRVQAVVGTAAGIVSITGALASWSSWAPPATSGHLVTTVQEAGSHRGVSDATIEILTTQNDVVATLAPDATGRATQDLKEGTYVVRVSHPRYAADVRRVQVQPRQTVELRATLRAGSSSPVERAVNNGIHSVRRALGF
jgi:hypothetical protein